MALSLVISCCVVESLGISFLDAKSGSSPFSMLSLTSSAQSKAILVGTRELSLQSMRNRGVMHLQDFEFSIGFADALSDENVAPIPYSVAATRADKVEWFGEFSKRKTC